VTAKAKKINPEDEVVLARADVVRYLRGVMNNTKAPTERRDRAASRLVAIIGDAGVVAGGSKGVAAKAKGLKEQRVDDAQGLLESGSKFMPSAPPRQLN
jgi:hypothetical protein